MIKMVEFFAGIGSQKKSLVNIGVEHEAVAIAEWDVNAIISYDAIHTDDGIDYTKGMTKSEILKELEPFTFSTDGKKSCNMARMKEKTLRNLYNANKRSRNMGNITKIDNVVVADLWTYSFPCQDLSVAGKGAGLGKGTRSGLLYEIERLLNIKALQGELPKYLLMENVKNLVGKQFKGDFDNWVQTLENLGYNTFWEVVNAKNCGIPQNRERVFAISIRKDIDKKFEFPKPFDNGLRLKDMLEDEVDEKYYISQDKVEKLLANLKDNPYINKNKSYVPKIGEGGYPLHSQDFIRTGFSKISYTLSARDYKDPKIITVPVLTPDRVEKRQNGRRFKEDGEPMFTLTGQDKHGVLMIKEATKQGYAIAEEGDSINIQFPNSTTRRGRVGHQVAQTLETSCNQATIQNYRIRKLTPKECWRLMAFEDADIEKCELKGVSNSQLYKQAGNSIVVKALELLFSNLLK